MGDANNTLEQAAIAILTRAVTFDKCGRYTESLICYQEGLQLLMDKMKGLPAGEKKELFKQKIGEYIDRAEKIKDLVQEKKDHGNYHEEIQILDNSTGHSYDSIMGRFMDRDVHTIQITDPYIKNHNQFCNLIHFCELAVKKCENLKIVKLITNSDENPSGEQLLWFQSLSQNFQEQYKINFQVTYSKTLHDREIMFSNGWVIKIGRGLDFFKYPMSKYGLGKFDLHFRPCRETKVDIYHINNTKAVSLPFGS